MPEVKQKIHSPNKHNLSIANPHVLHFNLLQTHCPGLSQMAIESEVEHWDVVIVGAGIAGLVLAK